MSFFSAQHALVPTCKYVIGRFLFFSPRVSHLTSLAIYLRFPKYSTAEEGGRLRPGVVLLTGLMETMAKYGETIASLNDRYDNRAAKSVKR